MIDDRTMRTMLARMESAAQDALRHDRAFHEALLSLKSEIDHDPRVQSTVDELRAAGNRVFSSLVPHIRIRIRTAQGMISLPDRDETAAISAEPVAQLTRELRSAACAVMTRDDYREALDHIMNDAVGASGSFEGIASEIQRAGYQVMICLDLSSYAQVQDSSKPKRKTGTSHSSSEPLSHLLSEEDLTFLKALKISATEN